MPKQPKYLCQINVTITPVYSNHPDADPQNLSNNLFTITPKTISKDLRELYGPLAMRYIKVNIAKPITTSDYI